MSELLTNFGVNWKLLLAQAVNFVIIFWVLKRFAYRPVLKILKKRKEDIAKGLNDSREAAKRLSEAEKERADVLTAAKNEALGIVKNAEEEGKRAKEKMINEGTRKVEAVVMEAKKMISEEKSKIKDELFGETENLLSLGIMKILGKMKPEERDRELIHEALKELKTLEKT